MATNRDQLNNSNPTTAWSYVQAIGGLASLFENMLPTAARSFNHQNLAVSSHTVTMEFAGSIVAVESTEGTTTGANSIVSGAPSTTEVQVTYDSEGVATLTFAAADAVTECQVKANSVDAGIKAFLDRAAGASS